VTTPPAIRDLEAAAQVLRDCGNNGAQRVGKALAEWLAGKDGRLDVALGIGGQAGRADPRNELRRQQRDEHLRDAARLYGVDARSLAERLVRYASTSWRREMGETYCPPNRLGKIEEHLWRAMKAWPRAVAERQMLEILMK